MPTEMKSTKPLDKLAFTADENACLHESMKLLRDSMPKYEITDNQYGQMGSDPKNLGYSVLAAAVAEKYKDCVAEKKKVSR